MNFSTLLVALSGPIAKRVLTSLGFGVVSYVGVSAALNAILGQAAAAWGGISADVAQYLALAGVNQGLALLSGAMLARVSLMLTKRLMLI